MHHRCQKLMVHRMHPTPDHAGLLRLRLGAGWAWMRLSNSAAGSSLGFWGTSREDWVAYCLQPNKTFISAQFLCLRQTSVVLGRCLDNPRPLAFECWVRSIERAQPTGLSLLCLNYR